MTVAVGCGGGVTEVVVPEGAGVAEGVVTVVVDVEEVAEVAGVVDVVGVTGATDVVAVAVDVEPTGGPNVGVSVGVVVAVAFRSTVGLSTAVGPLSIVLPGVGDARIPGDPASRVVTSSSMAGMGLPRRAPGGRLEFSVRPPKRS